MDKFEKTISGNKLLSRAHIPSENEGISSIHHREKRKTLPYIKTIKNMKMLTGNVDNEGVTRDINAKDYFSDEYIFESDIFPYHSLLRSCLYSKTPEITAKDGYEIRWCDNLLMNTIKTFKLLYNEEDIDSGDKTSLFFDVMTSKDKNNILYNVGTRKTLTKWTEKLQEQEISLYLPYFYDNYSSNSFPLRYLGKGDTLRHVIIADFRIKNLLVIRNKDTKEIIDFDESLIKVKGGVKFLDTPQLHGVYTQMTSLECENIDCSIDEDKDKQKEVFIVTKEIMYNDDLKASESTNFSIVTQNPVESLSWGCINITDSEFTKNLCLTYETESIISKSTLKTTHATLFENFSSFKTERSIPLRERWDIPEAGYNSYSSTVTRERDPRKFSNYMIMNSGSLSFSLKDNMESQFKPFCILTVLKCIKIKDYPKTQAERKLKGSLVSV